MMGSTLKTERERQGLTIKDIEQGTSIRARYLEALENGKYDDLPKEVYVKGFIRNYAEFLHLDGAKLVQEYCEETHGTVSEAVVQPVHATTSMVNENAPFSSGSDFHERVEKSHNKQIFAMVVAAIVVIFVGSIYYFFGEDPSAVKPQQNPQQTVVQDSQVQNTQRSGQNPASQSAQGSVLPAQNSGNQTVQPSPQQPASPAAIGNTASAAAGQNDVTAKFSGRCWVNVKADGKVLYEGIVEANQTLRWTGKKDVVVTIGNAGAIDLMYNGQNIGKPGKEGDVVEKRFSNGKVENIK